LQIFVVGLFNWLLFPNVQGTLDAFDLRLHFELGWMFLIIRKASQSYSVKYIDRVIEVTSVNGSNPRVKLLVTRIIMINTDMTLQFTIKRKQFPLSPAFAMTANKSQGQTLARVGLADILYFVNPMGRPHIILVTIQEDSELNFHPSGRFSILQEK
jgi:hypothetical protein